MRRAPLVLVLALVVGLGCARGIVDESEGSITTDVPPSAVEEPAPARRVSADAPSTPDGTARASFDDPAGDAPSDGVDLRRIAVAQDKDFMLEVVVETSGTGDVDLYIDSDLNPRTGVDGFDVRASGSAATKNVELWFHEGGAWTAEDAPTFTGSYADGKLVMRIHRQYLGPEGSRGPIGLAAGTQGDRAPDGAPADRYTFTPL
jgi:hypothetical protein